MRRHRGEPRDDRVQLQQVALNLVLNAIEAMSSAVAGEGGLLISTERSQPGEVVVAARDSCAGIAPQDLERGLEPFYTTKSGGTGMGLSIGRSIIAAHKGRRWSDVNAPRGAVFRFTLPAAAKDSRIPLGRPVGPERRAETSQQMPLVNRLSKVADDPTVERARPVGVVGIGSEEDRRDRTPGIDEVSVEVDSGHAWHLDVRDQARRFTQAMGSEEIGGRAKNLDGVAQRPHEPSNRLAKELIIINDRNQ